MIKKKAFVSIIMPYFNKKFFFKKSLNSVLEQSFKNYEIIIIFDDKKFTSVADNNNVHVTIIHR